MITESNLQHPVLALEHLDHMAYIEEMRAPMTTRPPTVDTMAKFSSLSRKLFGSTTEVAMKGGVSIEDTVDTTVVEGSFTLCDAVVDMLDCNIYEENCLVVIFNELVFIAEGCEL